MALADQAPLPPFQASYDATTNTVNLTWQPPDLAQVYHYALYRGATLLAILDTLNYTDFQPDPLTPYYILQVIEPEESEAQRSNASQNHSPMVTSWIPSLACEPIVINDRLSPPFIAVGVRSECLPG